MPELGTELSFLTSVCFIPRHAQSLHAGLQRSSEALGRRYPRASKLELYHLSPCFSHEGKPCFLFSVQLLYPSPEERGLLSAWLETGDPTVLCREGFSLLGLGALGQGHCESPVFHVLSRARTVVAPLAFLWGWGLGVLTFILIFILVFGSCHLLANSYYVQVTAFYT